MHLGTEEDGVSKYEDQYDEDATICPYCGEGHQPEAETWDEEAREEECGECGRRYLVHQSFSVCHITKPDCEINGEEHQWGSKDGYPDHKWCKICGKCERA